MSGVVTGTVGVWCFGRDLSRVRLRIALLSAGFRIVCVSVFRPVASSLPPLGASPQEATGSRQTRGLRREGDTREGDREGDGERWGLRERGGQ